jgi:hypothetical protein
MMDPSVEMTRPVIQGIRHMDSSAQRQAATPARLFLQLAAAAALLAGCGGGGGDAGTSTATGSSGASTSSFAAGAISGFGSVIVNGVRFDDSTAKVDDDEGRIADSSALKLGMRVEIQGGAVSDDGTGPRATAREIRFGSELVGPVSAVDAVAKSLVVLGQTVLVVDTTVIDNRLVGGFAAITVGSLLEVHGTRDATTGAITATRIEPTAAAAGFKVRGIVANLDSTAKTFTIGAALVSYASANPVPANLANGLMVRVRLQTTQVAGAWVATAIVVAAPRVDDANEAEIEGSITAFTSSASFSVNGIPVDASSAAFPQGTAGVVLGAQVEVHGTSSNGVVMASRVQVEDHAQRHAEGFELHGAITAIDTSAKTFVLRGVTVGYGGPAVDFRNGTETQLAVGVRLEVRGTLSADGTMLQAMRISFGD